MQPKQPSLAMVRRRGRSYLGIAVFLGGFFIILFLVAHFFLLPAYRAYPTKTPLEQRQLRAVSLLLLTLLLIYLFIGLLVTFKIGRLLFPRRVVRTHTPYVDVWAESGRRLSVEPQTLDEEDGAGEDGNELET